MGQLRESRWVELNLVSGLGDACLLKRLPFGGKKKKKLNPAPQCRQDSNPAIMTADPLQTRLKRSNKHGRSQLLKKRDLKKDAGFESCRFIGAGFEFCNYNK